MAMKLSQLKEGEYTVERGPAEAGQTAQLRLSELHPEEFHVESVPEESSGLDKRALRVGVEKGVTFGARPLIAGLGGAAGMGVGLLQEGRPISEAWQGAKDAFSEARGDAQKDQAKLAEQSPGSSLLGEVGGTMLVPGAALKMITRGAKGYLGAARLGAAMGAGQALGEADNLGEGVRMTASGAALGAAGEGAARGVGKLTSAISRKLAKASAENAVKANGAMLKDFRTLEGKKGTTKFGQFLVDRGLVKAGDTFESVAQKTESLRKDAGNALDSIYSYAKNNFSGELPGFNPVKNKEEILNAAREKLGDAEGSNRAIKRLSDYLDDLASKYGDNALDPRKANDIKGAMDEVINYNRNPLKHEPEVEKAFHAAREHVSKLIDSGIDAIGAKTGSPKILGDLKEANSVYGAAKQATGMAKDRVNRESANKAFGLRQSILTGGGAGAGALYGLAQGGDPDKVLTGALGGAAIGASLKTVERYGPAVLAQAESALSKQIAESGILRRMIQKNPMAYQTLLKKAVDKIGGQGTTKDISTPIKTLTGLESY